jgi:quercetin dioxygenase-like cupin family protein
MTLRVEPIHTFTYGGAGVHVYHANKSEGIPKHNHKYSHATMCNSGSCLVTVDEKKLIMTKNTQPVNLVAGKWHEIEALEDGTVFVNIFEDKKY